MRCIEIIISFLSLFSQLVYSQDLFPRSGDTSSDHGDSSDVGNDFLKDQDYLWAYFETQLEDDVGAIGPSRWRDLNIPDNQCGGGGQKGGFGQSPVVIPYYLSENNECHTDLSGYATMDGTCTWVDVDYLIQKDSLVLRPKLDEHGDPICSLGTWEIPQRYNTTYEAMELHVRFGSEHIDEGASLPFEIQVFHQQIDGATKAAFSVRYQLDLSLGDYNNPLIQKMLNGWRTIFWETFEFCSEHEDGSEIFNVNSVLESQQKLLQCSILDDEASANTLIPRGQDFQTDIIPNFVSIGILVNNIYNLYTYEGGLTTPPCTENVYWNVVEQVQLLSKNEFTEMMNLLLCFKERSTCKHASVASEFGYTKRPPQSLNDREIVHRCFNGPTEPFEMKVAPEIHEYEVEVESESYYSLLFPWFAISIGLVVFYLLSRYIHLLPYTAVMFLLGTFMGIASPSFYPGVQLTDSISMWNNINGELLLLSFLPGLLFKDAYTLDVHLFKNAFGQILVMAFPMVLAGTVLTALVAFYVLPYNWSFNFCMTFGSILSATDPVAVAALLQELGAPPRLKTHIAGESLLNDGSAIVFFTIFRTLFLYEEGLHGGQAIGIAEGVWQFVKMSIGAALLGILFGIGLALSLYMLNRRFNNEEKIVQVTATVCFAYLSYYVADAVLHLSGVICVVFCGLVTKLLARSLIIDHQLMDNFWNMIEFILNTVLFCLGGVIWGTVITDNQARNEDFNGADWGYLILIYVLITVIRFFLFAAFFPIVNRIGLKSCRKEAFFQAFSGLRGALGITLAVLIDHEVEIDTVRIDPLRRLTSQLFGLVGGITLLTLVVNGPLCASLLKKLQLNRATRQRMGILQRYELDLRKTVINTFIESLGETYYKNLDFNLISRYVPQLKQISYNDIRAAIRRVKYSTPSHIYQEPDLDIFKGIVTGDEMRRLKAVSRLKLFERIQSDSVHVMAGPMPEDVEEIIDDEMDDDELKEMRLVFVELLRRAYDDLMKSGHIDVRFSFVVYVLTNSVAVTEDEVTNGSAINDWQIIKKGFAMLTKFEKTSQKVHLASAFVQAHNEAAKKFKFQVHQDGFLSTVERQILNESSVQVAAAYESLHEIDEAKLKKYMSLKLCGVLLNSAAIHISNLVDAGILKEQEGEHYFEHLEHDIDNIKFTKMPSKRDRQLSVSFLKVTDSDDGSGFWLPRQGEQRDQQFAEFVRP